jgi:ferredoxin
MQKFISKEDLLRALAGLAQEFELIGPKEVQGKGIFYETIADPKELCFDTGFAIEPAKKFFLSPTECVAKETLSSNAVVIETLDLPHAKRLLIGITPCEAKGLTLLDKVFDAEYKDNFYIHNRKRTVIVGLACAKADDTRCFCTSMNGSPVESTGMDAVLFSLEGGFIIDITSDKGKEIFASWGENLSQDTLKAWSLEKEKRKNSVKKTIKIPEPKTLDAIFDSEYWAKASQPCLSCGICTYLCPTCHCFDLVNESRKKLRCYDSCAFRDFTLQASGENPRLNKKDRYRQRVFHKFNYFRKNFGENLCVGCGRCVRFCPVKIDIGQVMEGASKSARA